MTASWSGAASCRQADILPPSSRLGPSPAPTSITTAAPRMPTSRLSLPAWPAVAAPHAAARTSTATATQGRTPISRRSSACWQEGRVSRYHPPVPRIDDIFVRLRADGRKALLPFVCGGFPGPGATAAVLPALERAGASIIEVGIPFSDPIADGTVIAAAMHEAIARGATPVSVFDEVAQARPQ